MTLRKHKNNRWFVLKYYFVQRVEHGHRWTGSKMEPRTVETKPGPLTRTLVWGSDPVAVEKAFRRFQDTTLKTSIRSATSEEVRDYLLQLKTNTEYA